MFAPSPEEEHRKENIQGSKLHIWYNNEQAHLLVFVSLQAIRTDCNLKDFS